MLFDFTIEHVPGIRNIIADAMSRVFAHMTEIDDEDDDDTITNTLAQLTHMRLTQKQNNWKSHRNSPSKKPKLPHGPTTAYRISSTDSIMAPPDT